MSEQYTHLLIPKAPDFRPRPEQITAWVEQLEATAATPTPWGWQVAMNAGRVLTGRNGFTGESLSIPVRDRVTVERADDIPPRILDSEDYDIVTEGGGPAAVPPFNLYALSPTGLALHQTSYWYSIRCCLRKEPVSMSSKTWMNSPCPNADRVGRFDFPVTELISFEVEDAGCARFWIEFQFGKWLFPKADKNLRILNPTILALAESAFGIPFAQGCRFD